MASHKTERREISRGWSQSRTLEAVPGFPTVAHGQSVLIMYASFVGLPIGAGDGVVDAAPRVEVRVGCPPHAELLEDAARGEILARGTGADISCPRRAGHAARRLVR